VGNELRKATGIERGQPKKEAMCPINSKATGARLPKPIGAHTLIHVPLMPDMKLKDSVFTLLGSGHTWV
jgi:hypothetical protein